MSSVRRNAQGSQAANPSANLDCWQEMERHAASGGQDAWARLASQRPATEERLSRLVGALEKDIIPRLVRAHALPDQPRGQSAAPTAAEVESFTALLLSADDPGLDRMIQAMLARGMTVEALFVDLLAPTARHLGAMWDDDRCHFADVTIGLGRLQQIMRGLSSAFGTEIDQPTGGRRALLMPAPGEQHTFGLSMVAEFFARAGWEVAGVLDPVAGNFQDRVAREWFDLVGISAGSSTRLDGVVACIEAVRTHSHNRHVTVMVGGPVFLLHPELADTVKADAVATDGQQAPRLADQLLSRRSRSA